MKQVELYGLFEMRMPRAADASGDPKPVAVSGCAGNPNPLTARGATEDLPTAVFAQGAESVEVRGFCEGEPDGVVRFMPHRTGQWHVTAEWGAARVEGTFECVPNTGANHGPVSADGCHFRYADGTAYLPAGTTCYAWTHQTPALVSQTLETLAGSPFNKLRMCVFPKSAPFNENDPERVPFLRNEAGEWDVHRPDAAWWAHFEDCIRKLGEIGIEADIILWHPYDRWGFAKLSREDNLVYLDYAIRRLAAFRNVWWSLANEQDLVFSKGHDDWDAFGDHLLRHDPYRRLTSIHNWLEVYPKRPWMTHVSLQHHDMGVAFAVRVGHDLPLIVDELGYEGEIAFDWGNLGGFEMINRMWTAVGFGCYAAHGETFVNPDDVLWWAKGGTLRGEAIARIRFLREFLESLPGGMEPFCRAALTDPASMAKNPEHAAFVREILRNKPEEVRKVFVKEFIKPVGAHPEYRLIYLARHRQTYIDLELPTDGIYRVELLNVWEMTREMLVARMSGSGRVRLPGSEGMALLVTRLEGARL